MVGLTASDVPPTMAVKIFSAGVAACVADVITFPLDTAKVRLQVASEMGTCLKEREDIYSVRPFDKRFGLTTPSQGTAVGPLTNGAALSQHWMQLGWETGML